MEKAYKYMVCTRCFTYNHAPYIADALNGFKMQQTTFPIVYCVVDDASTDGEQEVLRKWGVDNLTGIDNMPIKRSLDYGDMYIGYLKNNPNATIVILLLRENHYKKKSKIPYIAEWLDNAKYVALCEGDDYWIVEDKLQKQVDFLETHLDYGMCYCNFNIYDEETKIFRQPLVGQYNGIKELILKNHIATLTTVVRSELYSRYLSEVAPRERGWRMSDYPQWLWMELESKIYYIDKVVAVYRILPESASHSKDIKHLLDFIDSTHDIRLFFADKYLLGKNIKEQINNVYWREKARVLKGNDVVAYKEALRNIRKKTIKEWIKTILPN